MFKGQIKHIHSFFSRMEPLFVGVGHIQRKAFQRFQRHAPHVGQFFFALFKGSDLAAGKRGRLDTQIVKEDPAGLFGGTADGNEHKSRIRGGIDFLGDLFPVKAVLAAGHQDGTFGKPFAFGIVKGEITSRHAAAALIFVHERDIVSHAGFRDHLENEFTALETGAVPGAACFQIPGMEIFVEQKGVVLELVSLGPIKSSAVNNYATNDLSVSVHILCGGVNNDIRSEFKGAAKDRGYLFVRNLYETRRMQYTLYNAIGDNPQTWRNGKPVTMANGDPLVRVNLSIPDEINAPSFWPWRSEQITELFNSCPPGKYSMEAWDVYCEGAFRYTEYYVHVE